MRNIEKPEELVAVSIRQGVALNTVEAEIILGYTNGHDYDLVTGEDTVLKLRDRQAEEGSPDDDTTIREVIETCQELNDELLRDVRSSDNPNYEYLFELRKDEFILDGAMQKAKAVIPPTVRRYNVLIIESLRKSVPVMAASWEEAVLKVREMWNDGEIVLTADDFAGVNFTLGN